MNSIAIAILLFVSLVFGGFCGAAEDRYVVLITMDGLPASTFWDTNAPLPVLRKLAADGVSSTGMKVSNPTVTWPNHTTLISGVRAARHGVLFNGVVVRAGPGLPVRIDEERDKTELVAVRTLFDVLHEHGYRTAGIDWPCTRNSDAVDDNFPDVPDHLLHTTPRLKEELLAEGILTRETEANFEALGGTQHDEIWTRAACLVIQRRKPHFLAFHLLNTDGVQHRYGPQSPASYRAMRLADGYLARVLKALDDAGIRERTTVFVTADHGFARIDNLLQPNVLLRRAGLLELGQSNRVAKARAQVMPEGGIGMVYLTNPETRETDRQNVLALFTGQKGIEAVIPPERYASLGFPGPQNNPAMADLILAAQDGYGFLPSASGEEFVVAATPYDNHGTHGYLASHSKMDAMFVAAGRGIKRGVKIGAIENIDLAPTIAHLLGEKLEQAEGKILQEILSP